MFDASSRYATVPDLVDTDDAGRRIVYKARRFSPQPGQMLIQGEVTVQQGDRPDLVAARCLGQSELYWRVADANGTLDPFTLTAIPGRKLRVPRPQMVAPVPKMED
jgi:hypothetical protein